MSIALWLLCQSCGRKTTHKLYGNACYCFECGKRTA